MSLHAASETDAVESGKFSFHFITVRLIELFNESTDVVKVQDFLIFIHCITVRKETGFNFFLHSTTSRVSDSLTVLKQL